MNSKSNYGSYVDEEHDKSDRRAKRRYLVDDPDDRRQRRRKPEGRDEEYKPHRRNDDVDRTAEPSYRVENGYDKSSYSDDNSDSNREQPHRSRKSRQHRHDGNVDDKPRKPRDEVDAGTYDKKKTTPTPTDRLQREGEVTTRNIFWMFAMLSLKCNFNRIRILQKQMIVTKKVQQETA